MLKSTAIKCCSVATVTFILPLGRVLRGRPRSHPPRSPSELAPRARAAECADEKSDSIITSSSGTGTNRTRIYIARSRNSCARTHDTSAPLAHAHAPGPHAHASPHLSHAMKKRNLKRVARSFVRSRVVPRARVTPRFGARTVVYQVLSALFICLRVVVVNNFV